MWIVNWLVSVYERLYDLVTNWYDRLRQIASYGLDALRAWTRSLVDVARSSLSSWIDRVAQDVRDFSSWLSARVDSVSAWVDTQINRLSEWVAAQLAAARDFAMAQIDATRDWLLGVIQGGLDWLGSIIQDVIGWAERAVQDARDWAQGLIDDAVRGLRSLLGQVRETLMALVQGAVDLITSFRSTWESKLSLFFTNPGRFIFTQIEAYVYAWAEWFLAVMLKGESDPVPVRPDFFSSGASGGAGERAVQSTPRSPAGMVNASVSGVSSEYSDDTPWIDVQADPGYVVASPSTGVVIYAGYAGPVDGNQVIVRAVDGALLIVSHLDDVDVGLGDYVSVGRVLGTTGTTGAGPGSGVRVQVVQDGQAVNPSDWASQV